MSRSRPDSKQKFLDAALRVIRTKGYEATTVDDICEAAGLTKGSFFHHFDSKEDLAVAAAAHFGAMAEGLFTSAPYRQASEPLERLLGYVDFRAGLMKGDLPDFTCLLGTMVQETYETHPAIREACDQAITAHAKTLEPDLAEARRRHAPGAPWEPAGMALFIQSVIQGAFILAKARNDPKVAAECLAHLRRYLETQLPPSDEKPTQSTRRRSHG